MQSIPGGETAGVVPRRWMTAIADHVLGRRSAALSLYSDFSPSKGKKEEEEEESGEAKVGVLQEGRGMLPTGSRLLAFFFLFYLPDVATFILLMVSDT